VHGAPLSGTLPLSSLAREDSAPRVPLLSHTTPCRMSCCSALPHRAGSTPPGAALSQPSCCAPCHRLAVCPRVRRRGRRSSCSRESRPMEHLLHRRASPGVGRSCGAGGGGTPFLYDCLRVSNSGIQLTNFRFNEPPKAFTLLISDSGIQLTNFRFN
jgi:hypothetical protein